MASDIVRVLRILEYFGPREWAEDALNRAGVPVNGQMRLDETRCIRSAIVGAYPEILEKANGE